MGAFRFHDGKIGFKQEGGVAGRVGGLVAETQVKAAGDAEWVVVDTNSGGDVHLAESLNWVRETDRRGRRGGGTIGGLEDVGGLEVLHFMYDVHDDQVDEDADVGFVVATEDGGTTIKGIRWMFPIQSVSE